MWHSLFFPGFLALAVAVPVQTQGQAPFGVTMGSPISKYPSCEKTEQAGWFKCETLPRSHASFEMYIIQAHPTVGVCFVKGIGKDLNRDPRGLKTRAEIEKLVGQLEQTYGRQTRIRDTLSSRSELKAEDDWMAGVKEEERIFSYDWSRGNYPNNVASIHVFARASDDRTGYAVAEFYFNNDKACDDELDKLAF
jgi:hypothetical protein